MSNMRRGFTMVELLIVIAIIGILTTIGFMSFGKYQADARDSERSSKATIISKYLEKYYTKNGEYPSCPSLVTDPNTVKTTTLVGINTDVLTTPQKPSNVDNSIQCSDLTSMTQDDYFAYIGDGSAACETGVSCLEYTIKYKDESTNSIASISSKHQTDIKTSGNIANLTATATGFTSIDLAWDSTPNAASYTLQRASDINFSSNLVSTSLTGLGSSITGLSYNTKYYFRVQPVGSSGTGNWSNTNATTWNLTAPCSPLSHSQAGFTSISTGWCAVSHATGYEIQRATDSGFTAGVVTQTSSTTSHTVTGLAYGTQYYIRIRATASGYTGTWSNTIIESTWSLGTPSTSISTTTTTTFTQTWNSTTHAASYLFQCSGDGTTWGSGCQGTTTGTSYTYGGATPGRIYYVRVQGVNGSYYGPWSNVANGTTTISAPSVSATTNSTSQITASWGAVSGATSYSVYYANNSSFTGQVGVNTTSTSHAFAGLTPGKTWYFRAYTNGANRGSGWSNTAAATTTSPVLSGGVACTDAYNVRAQFTIYLRLNETAYNVSANSSTVMWTVYRYVNTTWSGTWNQNTGHSHSVVVNGTSVFSGASRTYRFYYSSAVNSYEHLYGTSTANTNTYDRGYITVAHNADGSKAISASISDSFGTQVPGVASCSIGSYTLSDLR